MFDNIWDILFSFIDIFLSDLYLWKHGSRGGSVGVHFPSFRMCIVKAPTSTSWSKFIWKPTRFSEVDHSECLLVVQNLRLENNAYLRNSVNYMNVMVTSGWFYHHRLFSYPFLLSKNIKLAVECICDILNMEYRYIILIHVSVLSPRGDLLLWFVQSHSCSE